MCQKKGEQEECTVMSYRRKKRLTWVGVTNEGNRMSGAGPSKNGPFLVGREQELEIVKGSGPLDGNPSAVDCKEHSKFIGKETINTGALEDYGAALKLNLDRKIGLQKQVSTDRVEEDSDKQIKKVLHELNEAEQRTSHKNKEQLGTGHQRQQPKLLLLR
ncbi:hypothetical protein QQP08_004401 [Theobroma cacao]|nr:hypothetical protein QQP08_004401 [Theobroma cacao]